MGRHRPEASWPGRSKAPLGLGDGPQGRRRAAGGRGGVLGRGVPVEQQEQTGQVFQGRLALDGFVVPAAGRARAVRTPGAVGGHLPRAPGDRALPKAQSLLTVGVYRLTPLAAVPMLVGRGWWKGPQSCVVGKVVFPGC